MDNANKAIIMAFGMIVAVMILGMIVYVFSGLKSLPMQEDTSESIEQLRLFNQEYEVYEKKIMYGVDIISVLNKAQSNNDKYILGKFHNGIAYNTDYIINIVVKFKKPLVETIKVTYLNNKSDGSSVETEYANGEGPEGINAVDFQKLFKSFEPNSNYKTLIYSTSNNPWSKKLKAQSIETNINGIYQLLKGKATEPMSSFDLVEHPDSKRNSNYTNSMLENDSTVLKQLISQSATMSRNVKNIDLNSKYGYKAGWNQATWYPAIYDIKTRKFKCNGDRTVYNATTGRICYMEFEEF